MRIGTWNVEYAAGASKNARRLEILRSNPADIWVLTETHDDLDLCASHETMRSQQRPNRRKGERWATIWSSFPIRSTIPVNDEERTVAALVDTPSGPLMIFGTVLPWQFDRGKHPDGTVVRSWSEQYRVIDEQTKEWSALRNAHPGVPLCVAGDLNLNLGGPHWYGTDRGRGAMWEAMRQNGLICCTEYNSIPRGLLAHPPIDHVLISENLAVDSRVAAAWEGKASNGVRLSDHSGLVVELRECPRW